MAITIRINFKWYDGLCLSLLATGLTLMAITWNSYAECVFICFSLWMVVDCPIIVLFHVVMFADIKRVSGLALDIGRQQCDSRFCGRVVFFCILALLLYPFQWFWTVVGTLWFANTWGCLPGISQWTFFFSLVGSSIQLVCITCLCIGKWLRRRKAHLLRAQPGIPISEFGILVNVVRVPDWEFEDVGQEMRKTGLDAATYHPGLYLTIRAENAKLSLRIATYDTALETAERGGIRQPN